VFRCPFVSLSRNARGRSPPRALTLLFVIREMVASSSQVCYDGCVPPSQETRVQETHLHLAHRTCGASPYIPSGFTASLTCSFPLCLSAPGRSVVLKGHMLSTFCLSQAISPSPQRRTEKIRRTIYTRDLNLNVFSSMLTNEGARWCS
jgi:hypothetical protein